ncbi:hypothetical protein EVC45_14810 [Paraburkholderia sp. UYCP14C]|uniref:hypothetical protein n=1 Tax=Paraburkholderia sp. UYCP14C TaxID=2511130 RepID=UPI00101EB00D|nr:hypothetical protein [Paraburkholderia sp. UYCP14C]RZF29078.1 hypothetical protein EVC45_14810 [Paraburkholderia sp. UYCP14C]
MKLTAFSPWRDATMSASGSRTAPDARPTAFDQVLRVMEKGMWSGAKAGAMSEDPKLAPQRRAPAGRDDSAPAFDPRSDARSPSADNVSEPHGYVSVASARVEVEPHAPGTGPEMLDRDGANAMRSAVWPIVVGTSSFAPSGSTVHEVLSRDHAIPHRVPRTASPAASIAARAANAGSAPTPYRLTVMTGEAGVSVALRINLGNANVDETEALTQHARDELRRAMPRAVRLTVNGVEHIPTTSQGIAHGY